MDKEKQDSIAETIRKISDKDSKAYKVTEHYYKLTSCNLNSDEIASITGELESIEKDLKDWIKEHPKNRSVITQNETIMQPEESALILINYLRDNGYLK